MNNTSGIVRVASVALVAAALAVGATRVGASGASVQLASADERAGLPESSSVLVDEAALVCPGQQRLGAVGLRDVAGTVSVAAAAPEVGVVAGAAAGASGSVRLSLGTSATGLAQSSSAGSPATADVSTPDLVVAAASGALAPGLVATQVWRHTGDDDRGLALTPCQLPSSDVWLVGGGAGASRTERVIVSNPGANAVSVSLDVLGRSGRVEGSADRSIPIPPLSRQVISLDAIAPAEAGPVVHVVATGGVVSAVLDDQWISGATGRGIDDATRAASPGTDLVVPGIEAAPQVLLRLANPGDTEALAQVRLLGAKGVEQPAALRAVRVPAGSTLDVPVAVSSASAIGIRSDQPLVGAAWSERRATTGDQMGDFAWAPATPAIRGVAGVLLPGLPTATKRLLLTAGPAQSTVTVRRSGAGASKVSTVTVAPDSTTVVDVGPASGVWVTPVEGTVRAALSVTGQDAGVPFYSVAPLVDAPVRALSVPVRQVRN